MKELDGKSVDELMTRIMNKEITICENCDHFFAYSPQKRYCSECNEKRKEDAARDKRLRWATDPEYRERLLEVNKQWFAKKKQEDPEWFVRRNRRRAELRKKARRQNRTKDNR